MKEKELRKIVEFVCNGYVDTIMENIEDNKRSFPYAIACANYIAELKERNIIVGLNDVFIDIVIDIVIDRIFREFSNYIGR